MDKLPRVLFVEGLRRETKYGVKVYQDQLAKKLLRKVQLRHTYSNASDWNNFFLRAIHKWFILPLYVFAQSCTVDVVHITDQGYSYLGICRLISPAKFIITVHDLFGSEARGIYWFLNRQGLLYADWRCTDSDYTRHTLQNFISSCKKTTTIHLGTSLNCRSKKVLNTPKRFFLAVVSNDPRKNLKRIISAAHLVNTPLICIGAGIYKGQYSKNIIFFNNLDDAKLAYLYEKSTALVFVSLKEGFGFPIVDAMTRGCPVITSNITSMPELAENAAILVNPTSVSDIREAMKKIIQNPRIRNRMMRKGKQRAKQFSWTQCANKTVQLYYHLAKK